MRVDVLFYLLNCLFQRMPILLSVWKITMVGNKTDCNRVHGEASMDGKGYEGERKGRARDGL